MLRRSSPLILAAIVGLVLTWSVCAGAILQVTVPTAVESTGSSSMVNDDRTTDEAASAAMIHLDRREQVARPDDRVMWLFTALAVLTGWPLRRCRGWVGHGGAHAVMRWLGLSMTSRGPPLGSNVRGRVPARPIALL
jgi:hypothetical protein